MNDDNASGRGATMIDRELPTRAHQARREPQIAAADGLLGRPGCRRLASSGEPTDDRPFRGRHLGNPGSDHSRRRSRHEDRER